MRVRELRLRNFRNHVSTALELGDGVNALVGGNGQGKTNVLEAVSYLGLTKSFTAASDGAVVRIGTDGFRVDGLVEDRSGRPHTVSIVFAADPGQKTVEVDGTRPDRLASVVGRFPVVVLAPEHGAIASGGPADRRRFIDLVLSQVSPVYLDDLLEYRRILRQRNRLLAESRRAGGWDERELDPWTDQLANRGARIIARRGAFLSEFSPYMERAYVELAGTNERPSVVYAAAGVPEATGAREAVEQVLRRRLDERSAEERRRGATLTGPHRDDLRFSIDGKSVQAYASQGQQKTLLVALKVAEFQYVRDRREETPVVLLDDVFSELDSRRGRHLLRMMQELGQTVITTTDENVFHGTVDWNDHHRRFSVVQGECSRVAAG